MGKHNTRTPRHVYAVNDTDTPLTDNTTRLRRELPLTYRYVSEWVQWRWDCLDCGAYGLRSDSRYNMRDTQLVALRHNCR
jgi:hypothetical protein